MSVKDFWEGDPDLFWAYRFSYMQKLKKEQETMNTQAWLQGAYIYEAFSVALSNAFSKTKSTYAKEPYQLNKEDSRKEQLINLQSRLKNRVSQVQQVFGGENKNG